MDTFLFAGGGTGGHLYPGLAIAEQITRRRPDARCVFLCSKRPLDTQILKDAGAASLVVPAEPPGFHPRRLIRFLRSWGPSVRVARQTIRQERQNGRVQVIAMGGFVAAPAAQAARSERVPLALVNLDAAPGKANRWISRFASPVFAVAGWEEHPGWTRVPPIVRTGAVARFTAQESRAAVGLDPAANTLLVTGGSQGAQTINRAMICLVERHPDLFRGWQVLHQCGSQGETDTQAAYDSAGIPARVVEFLQDMGTAWGAADLAVTRCGAGAVAEVWANGVPAVFLPYPYHHDEHQRKNARPLVEAGGAVLATDHIDPDATARELQTVLGPMLSSVSPGHPTASAPLASMRAALAALGPADGAARVAQALLGTSP